ncbi:SusD family protein [Filimonas lacunae]|uniref:SusD family protein n=1 Tax=Filimonas lacunae TaxID=477680 RepID=A0A173MHH8_9BACT|nr:RagB/SusD family nutrient uptake outer membrane protein [Filimonas lacunae]BAV06949.1 hypothetical protein FLA_2969 [Filimonas lacunae]SIS97349.1 SusD family protein [Filimonas lacunae]
MLQKYKLLLWCLLLVGLCSCKKYLSVQPEGSYSEDQVYSNPNAMQQALNGLYISLADSTLYGQFLSNTVIEMMGQRYTPPVTTTRVVRPFQTYQYTDVNVMKAFDGLWQQAYNTILAANLFITKANNAISNNVVTPQQGQLMIGEATAIRAMLHFDLLRLFGPVYASEPNKQAIPYYTTADGKTQPLLTAAQVMEKVLADYTTAASLLAADPVITQGVVNNSNFYSGLRNQRLNYYAVKGLMARAYLWAGQKTQAHQQAQEVLTQGEKWFPWTKSETIEFLQDNPDRIFSSEVLFSIYNPNMYVGYYAWFSPDLGTDIVLTADGDRLGMLYENMDNDYRYNINTWRATTLTKKCFFKFADVPDIRQPFRFLQPVLRKTELYYILAETESDAQQALTLLDTVRYHRNLPNLDATANVPNEIQKEYQKEFWGEGQLFFYYKRNNVSDVPGGDSPWSTYTPNYVVPLPLSETTPR